MSANTAPKSPPSKITPKAAALLALGEVWEEATRPAGARMPVLIALIQETQDRVEEITERVRQRRAKAAMVEGHNASA